MLFIYFLFGQVINNKLFVEYREKCFKYSTDGKIIPNYSSTFKVPTDECKKSGAFLFTEKSRTNPKDLSTRSSEISITFRYAQNSNTRR